MKKKLSLMLTVLLSICMLCACGEDPKKVDYNGKSYTDLSNEAVTNAYYVSYMSQYIDAGSLSDKDKEALYGYGYTDAQINASVPVTRTESFGGNTTGMYKVSIIAKPGRYDALKTALNNLGVTGMTVTQVMGCGIQKGVGERYRGVEMDINVLPKMKIEVIVGNIPVEKVIETAKKALYTGHIGDGKIFVYDVQKVVKVRTGEEDFAALKDVE